MFKLLPLLLLLSTCIVCGVASPEPDGRFNFISSSRISGSSIKPLQTVSLTAKSQYPQQQHQQQIQSNTVTSGEADDNNDLTDTAARQDGIAPASVTTITTSAPVRGIKSTAASPITRLTAVASAGSATASATVSRSGLRVSSSINVPSSSSSTTTVQHHILPAETLPLPITISTRPGLRTVIAPETITIHEPTVAKVGEVVQKIPTAVSHQSQTVVHKHARVVTPIVAPAVRTITSQVLRAYHTPLIFAPQTTVVRASDSKPKATASASASASVISNANNADASANISKYKH